MDARFRHRTSRNSGAVCAQIRPEQVVLALADYFGVAAEYFFGPTPRQDPELIPEEDRSVVEEFHDSELRSLAIKAVDLSPESQDLLSSIAEKLRSSEGLPAVPPGLQHLHPTVHSRLVRSEDQRVRSASQAAQ